MKKFKATTTFNIRSGPGVEFDDQGDLAGGAIIEELSTDGWCPILLEDDSVGWLSRKYLTETTEEETPSAPEPTPTPGPGPTTGNILYESELEDLYGRPRDPAPYLVTMDFTEFKASFANVKDFEGNRWGCRIYGHKLMAGPLKQAFKNLVDRGYAQELRTYDGCTCVRPKTSGNGWSVHSWGFAIDFNAGTNPYGGRPRLSPGFVKCFTDVGFEWGGTWNTPDGMHFQLPKTWG